MEMISISLTQSPGAYALELHLPQPKEIAIGQFGQYYFNRGVYIYLGSAQGRGGINARLGRHITGRTITKHWHIDYLRCHAYPLAFNFIPTNGVNPTGKPIECCWSQALANHPGFHIPVPRFGASDCAFGCKAHLLSYLQFKPENGKNQSAVLKQTSVLLTLAHSIDASVDELIENASLINDDQVVQHNL